MLEKEKRDFTSLIKSEKFFYTISKLTIGDKLTIEENTYILSISLIFIKLYELDKRHKSYLEFAYYIILRYSLNTNNYEPLFDFSVNFGFFPISRFILDKNLIKNTSLKDFFIDMELGLYFNGEYTETLEQYNVKKNFHNDSENELSLIAPTSYGKSSIIVDYLKGIDNLSDTKISIIVPTKSLLAQTYKLIKGIGLNTKLLINDEMYNGEEGFIGIFTQERALRLLKKDDSLKFDILFIDEAHNLFEKDTRSILLTRLINRGYDLNPEIKIIYLSPLISDVNNLKINESQSISKHRINFNIKEPEIFEYRDNNEIYIHNRFFVGDSFKGNKIGVGVDYIKYIVDNSMNKNFLYHRTPTKIEEIAKKLSNTLNNTHGEIENSDDILKLTNILEKEVNKDFYALDYIKNGVVYLHGKIPDLIKEFLEFQFKKINELKYIVSNTVILEGINLPIDSLFILNTYGLSGNKLINLVGRVNRLNNIFSEKNSNLKMLSPKIHFVDNEFQDSRSNQFNTLKLLRSNIFDDKVKNPILKEFDINKITDDKLKAKMLLVQENEKYLEINNDDDKVILKKYLIENGINDFYIGEFFDKAVDSIFSRLHGNKVSDWNEIRMLDKINYIFIDNCGEEINSEFISYISDFEIKRLGNIAARDYYEYFIDINLKMNLSDNIKSISEYFKEKGLSENETDRKFYFGASYGDSIYDSINYPKSKQFVYVDMKGKSDKELVNLSIIKMKLEEDYVSFKLNKLFNFLFDFKLISEENYNDYIYGTSDKEVIKFINGGLTPSLTKRLKNSEQLKNISFDDYNNLEGNENFKKYKNSVDEFYRFELEKFIN